MLTTQNKMIKVAQALLHKDEEVQALKETNPLTEIMAGSYVLLLCPEGVNGRAQAQSHFNTAGKDSSKPLVTNAPTISSEIRSPTKTAKGQCILASSKSSSMTKLARTGKK